MGSGNGCRTNEARTRVVMYVSGWGTISHQRNRPFTFLYGCFAKAFEDKIAQEDGEEPAGLRSRIAIEEYPVERGKEFFRLYRHFRFELMQTRMYLFPRSRHYYI